MKINDPHILKMFNKPVKKGGYTPAELSKKFDIQKYTVQRRSHRAPRPCTVIHV